VVQVIAHSREHPAFIDAFEGDQRIVPHHLVAVIQRNLADPLIGGDRRLQILLSSTYFALIRDTSAFGSANQKS
jgi:hypothetical protein